MGYKYCYNEADIFDIVRQNFIRLQGLWFPCLLILFLFVTTIIKLSRTVIKSTVIKYL